MTNSTEHDAGASTTSAGDAIDFLTEQHHTIRDLFTEVADSTGEQRRSAFERLVRLLAVHETAEEQLVHPLAKKSGHVSADMVDLRLAEEREAKDTLQDLERMGPEAQGFDTMFEQFRGKVTAHARHEEVDEFPSLRESVPAERLRSLVPMLKAAEAVAPTHPHPGTESAAANYAAGPALSLFDRTKDLVRKALGDRPGE
ncbi:hemerythrin domain-containing protein [Actinophytocola sp.]|uniref:hemerythrin domain-containing protein n=1 Tax=Actinophytocola sp. TaxID=1872138 RepID=UPI003899D111